MTTKKKAEARLPFAPEPTKPPPGRLTVSRLTVHGVLGVEDSVIDLADITVLSGANASGKSSHLKALRSALGVDRTALARLARIADASPDLTDPAEEPSVEVLLVGEDREVLVSKKGDGSPEVRERVGDDWRKVPRPVEWLRSILDVEAANPAAWLAADDETKATAVLAAMPLTGYSRADALRAAGLADFRLPPIPAGLHPLEDLEQIEAAVFSSRTEVNRQERAEHDAATKLLAGLPAEPPKDVAATVAAADLETSNLAGQIAKETEAAAAGLRLAQERAEAAFLDRAGRIAAAHEVRAANLRAETERRIAALLVETRAAVDGLRGEKDTALDNAEEARQTALRAIEGKRRDLGARRERLAGLREAQRAAETDRHVRATAAEAEAKAKEHEARARALTAGIDALRRYRLELAGRLPIKGLRVVFDEKGRKSLHLDDVPLAQVNTGRLVELATEVSLLRSRPATDGRPYLPLVLLDGIEALDPKARAALLREVAARGAQVVAACVGPEAMRALRGEAALGGEVA